MKLNKKSLVLLVCLTLLLTFAVSGTVAFLADNSGPVVNEFTPAEVNITVDDKVENNVKKDVAIKNESTIPVYIRVAVVGNWYNDDGEIVAPWNDVFSSAILADNWEYFADGYYYYKLAVQPTKTSVAFFKPETSGGTGYPSPQPPVTGAHLEITIIAQAIQTEPVEALTAANWSWTPTTTSEQ